MYLSTWFFVSSVEFCKDIIVNEITQCPTGDRCLTANPGPFETDNREGYEVWEDNSLGDSDIFFEPIRT